jgi:hydrogenase maturation protease
MSNRAEQVAKAVLYEGYILYPYRPSSVKNQQRWNFGVVYPTGSSEGASRMQTQCLALIHSSAAMLDVKTTFLHLTNRTISALDEPVENLIEGSEPASHPVARMECDGQLYQTWQEGVERSIELPGCRLEEMAVQPVRKQFTFPWLHATEPIRDESGQIAMLIVREQQALSGSVEMFAEPLGKDLWRITIRLENLTVNENQPQNRDGALLRSLVSAHKILTLHGGDFISLIDPPEACSQAAGQCKNVGTFPVLAGEEGQRDVILSSPIILYDYPQIAPESAGDLCDGTEIDEILSLRILTLTDEEKREMRQSDERGRRILERTESLQEDQWLKLHGVLRGLRPSSEATQ